MQLYISSAKMAAILSKGNLQASVIRYFLNSEILEDHFESVSSQTYKEIKSYEF